MSSFYRQQLEEWLSQLDVKADRVLDVGGSQLPVKDRVKSWDVKEYKIMDLEQPHKVKQQPDIICDLNKGYISGEENEPKIIMPWITYDFYSNNYFFDCDIIFCLEVMEYIWNPILTLYNIKFFLKEKGMLYITFPTVYPVHEPREQDYLRYTKQGAIRLLDEAGFKVLGITPRTTKQASLRQFYSAEGMRAAKEYEGHEDVGYIIKAQKI